MYIFYCISVFCLNCVLYDLLLFSFYHFRSLGIHICTLYDSPGAQVSGTVYFITVIQSQSTPDDVKKDAFTRNR